MRTYSILMVVSILLYNVASIFGQCNTPKISQAGRKTVCENDDVFLMAENCNATIFWYTQDPSKNKNIKPFDFGSKILVPKIKKSMTVFARCEKDGCYSETSSYIISVTNKDSNLNANFSYGLRNLCADSDLIKPIPANKNTKLGSFVTIDSLNLNLAKDGTIYPNKSKAGIYYISNVVTVSACQEIVQTTKIQIKKCSDIEKCPTATFKLPKKVYQSNDSVLYRPLLDTTAYSGTWTITGKYSLDNDGGFVPAMLTSGSYIITNTVNEKQCKKVAYSDTIKIVNNLIKGNTLSKSTPIPQLVASTSSSQDYSATIIPPSPNAASLGKYGDVNVSYYTGKPSTDIPLYTIKSGDITVPISLSYSHGGILVEEDASNVGLGWSLNAGGVITRTIKGLDDLKAKGIPFIPLPATPETDTYFTSNFYDNNLGFPGVDTEYDIFYYNVGGASGKFILKSTNGAFPLKGIPLNGSDISINCTLVSGATAPPVIGSKPKYRWEIILENGMKYIFEEQEISSTISASTNLSPQSFEANDYTTLPPFDFNRFRNGFMITSWYISKIESPFTGESVSFNYDTQNYYYSFTSIRANEVYFKNNIEPNLAGSCISPPTIIPKENTFTYSTTITRNAYLKNINFNRGKSSVQFDMSDRRDIQKFDPLEGYPYPMMVADIDDRTYSTNVGKKPQKIDGFKVLSGSTEVLSWKFNYSYFNNSLISVNDPDRKSTRYLRLRLDGVQQKEVGTSNTLPAHQFYYYGDAVNSSGQVTTPVLLPSKTSWAKDYWGYYNGRSYNDNYTHIIPKLLYPKMYATKNYPAAYSGDLSLYKFELIGIGSTDDLGIDREPQENYVKYGSLQTIVYPTGGNTQFEFEQNRALGGANEIQKFNLIATNSSPNSYSYTIPTIDDLGNYFADVTFSLTCGVYPGAQNQYPCAPLSAYETDASIWYGKVQKGYNPNFLVRYYKDWPMKYVYPSTLPIDTTYKIALEASTYQVNVNPSQVSSTYQKYFPNSKVTMNIYKFNRTDYGEVMVGGLRIKRITNRDSSNILNSKIFTYPYYNNTASGKQMRRTNKYIYGYKEMLKIRDQYEVSEQHPNGWDYPCANRQWGIEINAYSLTPLGNSANGGNIGYSRVVVTDEGISNGKTEYTYVNQPDEEPESTLFADLPSTPNNSNGMLLTETVYKGTGVIKNIVYQPVKKSSVSFLSMKMLTPGYFTNQSNSLYLAKAYYKNNAEFWYNSTVTENNYGPGGFASSVSKFYYESNNHNLLTKSEQIDSKGNTLTTLSSYVIDKALENSSSIYNEMLQKGVKNILVESKQLNGNTQIALNSTEYQKVGVLFVPKNMKYQNGSLDPLVTKLSFDSYSNTGKVLSYTDETGITNQFTWWDGIDSIKYGLLKTHTINNQTKSYDYYPLIGVKSLTDPRSQTLNYAYDQYGRLISTRDNDNNLLSSTSYHFGNSGYYAKNCDVAAPSYTVTGSSLCNTTLTASGCTGTVIWNNGTIGNTLNLKTNATTQVNAVCLQQNGCFSTSSYSTTYPSLPYWWFTNDVGNPTPGCTQYTSGSMTLSGSGLVWSNYDNFHWAYTVVSGNFTLITKVSTMAAIDGRRSGIMFRADYYPDSPFYEIIIDGNGYVGKLKRKTRGGNAELVGFAQAAVGQTWLKLEKINGQIKAYYRLDSQTAWNEFGWDDPNDNPGFTTIGGFVGLVTSDNNNDLNTTTFTNSTLNGQGF